MTSQMLTDAFSSISDGLYRIAFHLLESDADARDSVQDLFIKLWGQKDTLDSVVNFQAYCTTLMKNLCIDRIRKDSRTSCQEIDDRDIDTSVESVERNYESRERLSIVMDAISRLPAKQQIVVRMYVLEEKSYDEISKETGMSNLTLRVLLSNARKSLRKTLDETY